MIEIQPHSIHSAPRRRTQLEGNHVIVDNNNTADTRQAHQATSEELARASSRQSSETPSNTTAATSNQYHWQHIYLVSRAFKTIMNAAVTIFGLGVGVGLILGDSLRGRTLIATQTIETAEESTTPQPETEEAAATIISLTPSCGGVARSSRSIQVQEPPTSTAATTLPAQ